MQRRKGRRVEYVIRDWLRERGFDAVRVPLSGASEGFKCDIVATKDALTHTFEVKSRTNSFKTIYSIYYKERGEDGVWRGKLPEGLVAISNDFESIIHTGQSQYFFDAAAGAAIGRRNTLKRLWNLNRLLGEAQYLVIKDNNKAPLFIRYYL